MTAEKFSNKDVKELPTPPDGGFGWVVVAASFFINFLTFGIMSCIGMIFDLLVHEFGCTRSEVSAVASLAFSLQCFLAPVASVVMEKTSIRKTAVFGSVIVGVALASSALAPKIYFLYFSFGILGGVGMALIYLPHVVLISFYFDRFRTLATALGSLGAFTGSFGFPYMYRVLISSYSWRGTLLILGGVALNSVAFSCLLRPVEESISNKQISTEESNEDDEEEGIAVDLNDSNAQLASFIEENIAGCNDSSGKMPETIAKKNRPRISDSTFIKMDINENNPVDKSFSTLAFMSISPKPANMPVIVNNWNNRPESFDAVTSRMLKKKNVRDDFAQRQLSEQPNSSRISLLPRNSKNSKINLGSRLTLPEHILFGSRKHLAVNDLDDSSKISSFCNLYNPMAANTMFFSHSGLNHTGHKEEPVVVADDRDEPTDISMLEQKLLKHTELLPSQLSVAIISAKIPAKKTLSILQPYLAYFRCFKFMNFLLVCFLKGMVFYIPAIYIVDVGYHLGYSDDQTMVLLSMLGIGNIIGRPIVAFFGDLFAKYRIYLLMLMFTIAGIVSASTYFIQFFEYLMFFAFMVSFVVGGAQTFITPFLADIVPMNELAFAFGIISAAEGAAMLAGPPLLGLLPDVTLIVPCSGIIFLFLPCLLFLSVFFNTFSRPSDANSK